MDRVGRHRHLSEHLGIRRLALERRVRRNSTPDWYLVSVTEQLSGLSTTGAGIPETASWFRFSRMEDETGSAPPGRSPWLVARQTAARPCSRRARRMVTGTSKGGDMRYPKGAIVLSDSLDVPALRKVYQAGHATAWQLYRALNPVFDESKWKSFVRQTRHPESAALPPSPRC